MLLSETTQGSSAFKIVDTRLAISLDGNISNEGHANVGLQLRRQLRVRQAVDERHADSGPLRALFMRLLRSITNSEPGAVATGCYSHLEHGIRLLPQAVLQLRCITPELTRAERRN
jgi:hypothetical protein